MTNTNATSNGRKRAQPQTDNETPTPTPAKKRKLNDAPANSPSGLAGIASAIGSVFGYASKFPIKTAPNGLSATSAVPVASPRPAIKLAALKGTIWDNTEKPRLTASPFKGSPVKGTPRKGTPAKGRATPGSKKRMSASAKLNDDVGLGDSPSKRSLMIRVNGYETGDAYDTDELSAEPNATPSKTLPGKRLWAASPAPKSILTPSKNRNATPKSVKFDKRLDAEVFFDDLPKSASAKRVATFRKPPQAKVIDEIVCGICSKPHSKPPNQIILCDNCDYAVHQECYGITDIPDGDWLCKSCSQDDAVSVPKLNLAPVATIERAVDVPDIPNLDAHLRAHQRVLLDRCAGRRRIEIFGLTDVHEKARQLVEQTVVAGEGNSMLLIGARGSGKTTLLENIIDDLSRKHGRDFHVVRLSGFIHTDDKLALKEIWRQLGKEMEVEDDLVNRVRKPILSSIQC